MPAPTSISQRIGAAPLSSAEARELLAILQSMRADTLAIATQFNQLRADYNAAIGADTTATAITLNTTA